MRPDVGEDRLSLLDSREECIEPLLDALASHFIESGYDLKQLVRVIMTSRLYQLDSQPTPENASDTKFYSHFQVKRLPTEALIDAIDRVTGIQTKYRNLPLGTRSIELPDAEYPDYFLNTFAKPRRVSVCECERAPDPSLVQALHTLNGDMLALKLRDAQREGRSLSAAETTELRDAIRSRYAEQTDIRYAAARGWVDAIIAPHETRRWLQAALEWLPRESPGEFRTGVLQV